MPELLFFCSFFVFWNILKFESYVKKCNTSEQVEYSTRNHTGQNQYEWYCQIR